MTISTSNSTSATKRMEDDSRILVHYFTPPSSPIIRRVESNVELKSLACASALVGEAIVLDSPTSHRHCRAALSETATTTATAKDTATAENGGLIGRGLSWWRTRRDQIRRELLEQQVEEQLRKLMELEVTDLSITRHDNNNSNNNNSNNDPLNLPHISKSGAGMSVQIAVSKEASEQLDDNYNVLIEDEPITSHAFCNYILTQSMQSKIAERVLPASVAHSKWKRLYSLARDGDAFDGFLKRVEKDAHTLLIIRTTKNQIFGGYTDSAWVARHQGTPEFYGSATACLWRVDEDNNIRVYKWTGLNRYIQYVDYPKKVLAFGGGGGDFGLCIERDFQRGSTGRCDTFGNDPLCVDENFEVVDLECFGFLLGQLSY